MKRRSHSFRLAATSAAVMAASLVQPVSAQTAGKLRLKPDLAAAVFGMRPTIIDASLSPDGTKLATVQPNGARGSVLLVLDLTNPKSELKPILGASGAPESLEWCRWVSNARLMCQVVQISYLAEADEFSYASRLTAIDVDGKNMQMMKLPGRNGRMWGFGTFGGDVIDWHPGKDGHVLVMNYYIPEFSTGTKISSQWQGLGVDDADTGSGSLMNIETPKDKAEGYVTDGHGRLRIMGTDVGVTSTGYASNKLRFFYRMKTGNEWLDLGQFDREEREGFSPLFVDRDLDVAYGLKKVDGRRAAYSVALDGSRKETQILARPDVDVDGFVTIGRDRRVVGASYTTDRNQVLYFDPKIKSLVASLSKAMPDLPLVRIVDANQDESKLLVWGSSDTDAGRFFVLDRVNKGMEEVAVNRLALEQVALSPVKSISFPARDGTMIPAYLTLPPGSNGKNLPAIVMPHGGPSARDEWGFDWLAQFWAQIGYAVIQPNFRGSAGYGDGWFKSNGIQGWEIAVGDVADAGRWLVKEGIADPKKLGIFGWSYGGYAALQASVLAPDLFHGIVAVAPVTDFEKLREERRNWSDFALVSDFIGEGPHVKLGSPAQQAAKISAPVLMFHGTYDRNVSIKQSQFMAEKLRDAGKPGQLVTYDKLDHSLDDSDARKDMLLKSAEFMEKVFASAK